MKSIQSHAMTAFAALALVAGSAAAQQGEVIPSSQDGALDAPETWNCDRIRPEYARWLEDGNAPADWRYAGITYRDVQNDRLYTWQDWLDWADEAGCPGLVDGQLQPNNAIGILLSFFGAGLIAAVGGERAISPG